MNSFSNFLWKFFSVTMFFLCYIGAGYAEGTTTGPCQGHTCLDSNNDPKIKTLPEPTASDQQKTICTSGKYLAKCGSYTIGTNLLFGISKKTTGNDVFATPNYHSYNSGSDTTNMENLRKFFNGKETMVYTTQTSDSENNSVAVQPSDYVLYRNIILSNICTDDSGALANIECETCPNRANITASTVDTNYDSGKLVWTSWNVHSIADCYMREFSDETGEYVYTASNVSSDAGINCYYTTDVPGSYLPRVDTTQ